MVRWFIWIWDIFFRFTVSMTCFFVTFSEAAVEPVDETSYSFLKRMCEMLSALGIQFVALWVRILRLFIVLSKERSFNPLMISNTRLVKTLLCYESDSKWIEHLQEMFLQYYIPSVLFSMFKPNNHTQMFVCWECLCCSLNAYWWLY